MQDFEWVSKSPLRSELLARGVASFGIFFAIACILLAIGYTVFSAVFLIVAVVASIVAIRITPPTKIKIEGDNLYYGSSMHARLDNLKEVRVIRQLGIEKVMVLGGSEPHMLIPLKGIPENVQSELLIVLNERISKELM